MVSPQGSKTVQRSLLFLFLGLAGCAHLPIESDAWVVENSCNSTWAVKTGPRWSWHQYAEILAELQKPQYLVVPMAEFAKASTEHAGKIVIGLRHDVDGNICAARTMARMEHDAGIRATYFVNHNDIYYSWRDERNQRHRRESSVYRYREIQDLGHEMGLHYDMLSSFYDYGEDPAQLLLAELGWLRKHGIEVVGGAAHGSKSARGVGFINFEVFQGMTNAREGFVLVNEGREYRLGQLKLLDYFLYEAYHASPANSKYYSEAGGAWRVFILDPENGIPALHPGDSAQVLIHPVWWGK